MRLPVNSRLTPIEVVGKTKGRQKIWLCSCSCGNTKTVAQGNLTTGTVLSCGCLQRQRIANANRETKTRHGQARKGQMTVEYRTYCAAKGRCENEKNKDYPRYGGRGIKFLFESFENFFAELGARPKGTSIDRIENDGNYEPGNVRWATLSQQNKNKRHPQRTTNGTYLPGTRHPDSSIVYMA